jgi:uncharacterized phage protein (TIGR01671 family)
MTRPIKFRAWDKEGKYWIPAEDILISANGVVSIDMHNYGELKEYSSDEIILTQFTGVLDKNGKEIWEGDVCKVQIWYGELYSIAKLPIIFRNGIFGYELYEGSGDWEMMTLDGHEEIIGNRFEHPHLLEGE